jgi:alpha-ketoglutarate-dependent taurine dioxygenase
MELPLKADDELRLRVQALSPERRALLEKTARAAGIRLPPYPGDREEQPATATPAFVPTTIAAPAAGASLVDWMGESQADVAHALATTGAVLLHGFDVGSASGLERAIEAYSGPALDYPGNIQSIIRRKPAGGHIATSTEYSAGLALRLHSECSFAVSWPLHIYFLAEVVAASGGATPIADNRRIYARIDPCIREAFERRGVMYLKTFGLGSSRPWQEVFGTSDRSVVEARCRAQGISAEWVGAGGLRTRSVRPAVVRHILTDEPLWFNHVNAIHVTGHPPEFVAALRRDFAPDDLPRHCLYGDGAEIDDGTAAAIRSTYEAETVRFAWQAGDVLLLDNMRCAHGRDPFEGNRRVLVGMACEVRRVGDSPLSRRIEMGPP